jgi:hypothetical protein
MAKKIVITDAARAAVTCHHDDIEMFIRLLARAFNLWRSSFFKLDVEDGSLSWLVQWVQFCRILTYQAL